jgi:hypothetical protein
MKVLYYCLHSPSELRGKLSGPRRSSRVICKSLGEVGIDVTVVSKDRYCSEEAIKLERVHDVVHCDNPDILTALLERSFVPDVIGARPWAPSKFYRDLGGYYKYPGYEEDPDRLYDDAVWVRNNFQEERFRPPLLKKIRVVQPCVEVDEIFPPVDQPFDARRYILWAGSKQREEKNWPLMEQIMQTYPLPAPYEWLVLDGYAIEEYLEILDQTALMIYTGKYESFGFQLFESWAKAVPTIYPAGLWGNIEFYGCGGMSLGHEEYRVEGYCKALDAFFEMGKMEQEQSGLASREHVLRDFTPARMGRELKLIYAQVIEAKKCYKG